MKKLLIVLSLALSSVAHAGVNDLYMVDMLCRSKADDSAFAYRQHQYILKDGPDGGMSRERLMEIQVTNDHYGDRIKEAKMHEIGQFAIDYAFDRATSIDDAKMATWTKCMDVMKIYR